MAEVNDVTLSIVIPLFNESTRLDRALGDVVTFVSHFPETCEVVFVDDGSTDGTVQAVHHLMGNQLPYRMESYVPHRGKGFAVRHGMVRSSGRYRLFMDADISTPLTWVGPFLDRAMAGSHVVIGTRRVPGSVVTHRQSWRREVAGAVFTLFCRRLIRPSVTDFTCGFKLFSDQAAEAIFPYLRVSGWAFDAEIIFLASALGYAPVEIPIEWRHHDSSHVHVLRDSLQSVRDVLRIRLYALLGLYDYPTAYAADRREHGYARDQATAAGEKGPPADR